jgi:hypothetical protein
MSLAGKGQYFGLDNSGGALQNLSTYALDIKINEGVGLERSETLGDSAEETTPTLTNGQISITFEYNSTMLTHLHNLKGLAATSTFSYGEDGNGSSKPRTTGECRLQTYERGGAVAGLVTGTATFLIDGTVTHDTYS